MTAISHAGPEARPTRATARAPLSFGASAAIGAGTAVVASVLTTLFAHDWREVGIVVPAIVVIAALVYGVVVPLAVRRGGGAAALTLGLLAALVAVPAFWSGLPLVLGVAAVVVGNQARTARRGAGLGIAGLALGALAALFYLSIYVMEGFAGHAGTIFG